MNQRWQGGRIRWRSDRETIRPSEYDVAMMEGDADARSFVLDHHYPKRGI